DPEKIGRRLNQLQVEDQRNMVQRIRELNIQIGIVAVPASAAQEVANQLIEAGVRAILNYAPITISVPQDVRIEYIDTVIGLQSMTYYQRREKETARSPTRKEKSHTSQGVWLLCFQDLASRCRQRSLEDFVTLESFSRADR